MDSCGECGQLQTSKSNVHVSEMSGDVLFDASERKSCELNRRKELMSAFKDLRGT